MIGRGVRASVGQSLRELSVGRKVAVITHAKIARLYGREVRAGLVAAGYDPITILVPQGERHKTLDQVERIYDRLIQNRFERGSTLVALGGGVIGDMTGFAAATFLRGIAYVQVPTTVVAQVDASIGGKTGVDHRLGKNLIGAFHQPKRVCIDPEVLTTLSRREYIAGLAEVVKYGVITDADFFSDLEAHADLLRMRDAHVLEDCIKRSATIKARVVSADERESGLRKILNYGHTLGHAVETLTGYERYKHGEAVAIGMMAAARLSHAMGLLASDAVERQRQLLMRLGLPTEWPDFTPDQLINVMALDKKVSEGEIVFILPEKIGVVRTERVSRRTLQDFLRSAQ
jgi:3-dehydroquinate synthase